ncbi:MAG: ExeA family protein [Candidatus Acidiferrales bacterium]
MYKKFYGLIRNPFEVSPDPRFYFQTPRHNEAMATISYGVLRHKGFAVVTGEVGTGKTLLVRCLLEALTRYKVGFAYVYNPMLSVPEFLAHVLNDLGLLSTVRPKGEMLSRLNNFLLASSLNDRTTALIVDEAHLLSWELFEEIRLLTNLETSQHKLLQIVLVGQPELDRKLDSQELRQLKQRVSLRCQLEPLGLQQLQGYILWRLQQAGANSHASAIFTDEAIEAIHDFSLGIPRLINTICDNCLVSGYSRQEKQVTKETVREVAAELRLDVVPTSLPYQGGETIEDRRNALKAILATLIDELGDPPRKSAYDLRLEPYAKTE